MNKNKKSIQKKIGVTVLVLCIITMTAAPTYLSGGICEKALARCGASLIFPGIIGIILAPAAVAAGFTACMTGYSWCLAYYLKV
jgi:predicted phage tail protein